MWVHAVGKPDNDPFILKTIPKFRSKAVMIIECFYWIDRCLYHAISLVKKTSTCSEVLKCIQKPRIYRVNSRRTCMRCRQIQSTHIERFWSDLSKIHWQWSSRFVLLKRQQTTVIYQHNSSSLNRSTWT